MTHYFSIPGTYTLGMIGLLILTNGLRAFFHKIPKSKAYEIDVSIELSKQRSRQYFITALVYALAFGLWVYHDTLNSGVRLVALAIAMTIAILDIMYLVKMVQQSLSNQTKLELLEKRALEPSIMGNLKHHPLLSGTTLAHANLVLLFIITPIITDFGIPVKNTINQYCQNNPSICEQLGINHGLSDAQEPQLFFEVMSVAYQYELLENIPVSLLSSEESKSIFSALTQEDPKHDVIIALYKLFIVGLLLSFVISRLSRRRSCRDLYHALNSEVVNHFELQKNDYGLFAQVREEMVPFFKEQMTNDPSLAGLLFRLSINDQANKPFFERFVDGLFTLLEKPFIKEEDRLDSHPLTKAILVSVLGDSRLIESEHGYTLFNQYVDEGTTRLLDQDLDQLAKTNVEAEELYRSVLAYLSCSPDDALIHVDQFPTRLKDSPDFLFENSLIQLTQALHPSQDTAQLFEPKADQDLAKLLNALHIRRYDAENQQNPNQQIAQIVYHESIERYKRAIIVLQKEVGRDPHKIPVLRRVISVLEVCLDFVTLGTPEAIAMLDYMIKMIDDQNDIVGAHCRSTIHAIACDQMVIAIQKGNSVVVNELIKVLSLLGQVDNQASEQAEVIVAKRLKNELETAEHHFKQAGVDLREAQALVNDQTKIIYAKFEGFKSNLSEKTPLLMQELGDKASTLLSLALGVGQGSEYSTTMFTRGIRQVFQDDSGKRQALLRQSHLLYVDLQILNKYLHEEIAAFAQELCLSATQSLNQELLSKILLKLLKEELNQDRRTKVKQPLTAIIKEQNIERSKRRTQTFDMLATIMSNITGKLAEGLEGLIINHAEFRKLLIIAQPSLNLVHQFLQALEDDNATVSHKEVLYIWCHTNRLFLKDEQLSDEQEALRDLLYSMNQKAEDSVLELWKLALANKLGFETLSLDEVGQDVLKQFDEICSVEVADWFPAYQKDPTGALIIELFEHSTSAPDQLLIQIIMENMRASDAEASDLTSMLWNISAYYAEMTNPILWDDYRRWAKQMLAKILEADRFENLVQRLAHGGVSRITRFNAAPYADLFMNLFTEHVLTDAGITLSIPQLFVLEGFAPWIKSEHISKIQASISNRLKEKTIPEREYTRICSLIHILELNWDGIQTQLSTHANIGPRTIQYFNLMQSFALKPNLKQWYLDMKTLHENSTRTPQTAWNSRELNLTLWIEKEIFPKHFEFSETGKEHLARFFACSVEDLEQQSLEQLITIGFPQRVQAFVETANHPVHLEISALANTVHNGIKCFEKILKDSNDPQVNKRLTYYKSLEHLINKHLTEPCFDLLDLANSETLLNLNNYRGPIISSILPITARIDWNRSRNFVRSIINTEHDFLYLPMLQSAIRTSIKHITFEDSQWLHTLYNNLHRDYEDIVLYSSGTRSESLSTVLNIVHELQHAITASQSRWPLGQGLYTRVTQNPLSDLSAAPMLGALSIEAKYTGQHIWKAFEMEKSLDL